MVDELRKYDRGGEDGEQADWLAKRLDHRYRFDHTAGRWHHWDNIRWAPDMTQVIRHEVDRLAVDALTALALDNQIGEEERKARMKIMRRLREKGRIDSALAMLASHPDYATDGADWDQNPFLLGCENGIVDLRLGELVASTPDQLITKTTGVVFKKDAEPERFWSFMREITSGDDALAAFYMMWFGYSLFGLNEEQRFLILTGLGRNGKGALVTAMRHVFGEYNADAAESLYMKTRFGTARSDGARADLMALKGKRLACMSEPDGQAFNEEMLKAHTGGDPITARALYSNNVISWAPTHSITFLTNRAPAVEDIGPAMASRVLVADFRERYDGDKEDKKLYHKLTSKTEAEGILRYLVLAAKTWWDSRDDGGLVIPERVRNASDAYISANDPLGAVIEEAFVVEPTAKCQSRPLHDAYCDWFDQSGREGEALSDIAFSDALKRRGFRKRKAHGVMVWAGIQPKGVMALAMEGTDDEES